MNESRERPPSRSVTPDKPFTIEDLSSGDDNPRNPRRSANRGSGVGSGARSSGSGGRQDPGARRASTLSRDDMGRDRGERGFGGSLGAERRNRTSSGGGGGSGSNLMTSTQRRLKEQRAEEKRKREDEQNKIMRRREAAEKVKAQREGASRTRRVMGPGTSSASRLAPRAGAPSYASYADKPSSSSTGRLGAGGPRRTMSSDNAGTYGNSATRPSSQVSADQIARLRSRVHTTRAVQRNRPATNEAFLLRRQQQEIRQKAAIREDRKEQYASQRREKQEREETLRKEMRDKYAAEMQMRKAKERQRKMLIAEANKVELHYVKGWDRWCREGECGCSTDFRS